MDKKGVTKQDPGWLILFLLILAVMWYTHGGKLGSGGIILEPPSAAPAEQITAPTAPASSADTKPKNKISIRKDSYSATDPNKEYITLVADYGNTESIDITGWRLTNKTGDYAIIGRGSYLPYSARVNPQEDIRLEPGGEALVMTGFGPLATNFRINACTGYFNQFQNFLPKLPEQCAYPKDLPGLYSMKDDACIKYIEKLPRCRMPQDIPLMTTDACRQTIENSFNYAGCVENEKNNAGFFSKNWRVYLGKNAEMWKDKYEKITLTDRDGNVVYELSY